MGPPCYDIPSDMGRYFLVVKEMNYEIIQTEHGSFWHRPGTSDLKAIEEVCVKNGYERRGFAIEAGEFWLDLGANVGAFSVLAALRGANVVAFEPDTENFQVLCRNIHWNSVGERVYPRLLGAWSSTTTLKFSRNIAKGNHWRNSLIKEWKGGEMVTVDVEDIAESVTQETNLKIDVEGAEKEIIDRLIETGKIALVPKFVLEWSFDIIPSIPDFRVTMARLKETHDLLGVSDNYMQRLEGHEVWPPAWFPPCAKVYGIRK